MHLTWGRQLVNFILCFLEYEKEFTLRKDETPHGNDKKVYIPKPNNPKPTAKERPLRMMPATTGKEVDIGKGTVLCILLSCRRKGSKLALPVLRLNTRKLFIGNVGNGVRAQVEAIGSFDLVLPNGLVICLDNCHYAPTITRGVVLVSRLVDNGFVHLLLRIVEFQLSKNGVLYFMLFLVNGGRAVDLEEFQEEEDTKTPSEKTLSNIPQRWRVLNHHKKEGDSDSFNAAMLVSESNNVDRCYEWLGVEIQSMWDKFGIGSWSIFLLVTFFDFVICQMDVKTAFLMGYLDEDIYNGGKLKVLLIQSYKESMLASKVQYGLKQASRSSNKRFDEEIKRFGITQNLDEPCVYQKASGSNVAFLILSEYILSKQAPWKLFGLGNFIQGVLYLMSYENACLRLGSYDPLNYIDRFEQAGVEKFDLINLSTAIANKRRVTQLLTMVLSERICWSATGRRGYYWLPHDIQKEDGSKLALPVLGFRIERSETRSSLLVRGQWCSLALVKQSESFGT
ncbi:retrotransposon protein, putative, ty1-copia subclass [Tanacetum coccineum]